jgi:hypothetical protein
MTKNDFPKLTEKFAPFDIEWRVQRADAKDGKPWAMVLPYIDARAIQDRLDSVCGPENWQDSYQVLDKGILCNLSIRVDGEWISKSNGAPETDIEGFKGGISKALVRAASTWGIGRYLYNLEATFAKIVEKGTPGAKTGQTKDKKYFHWIPPALPAWALPSPPLKVPVKPVPLVNHAPQSAAAKVTNVGMPPCFYCGSALTENLQKKEYYCSNYKSKKTKHVTGLSWDEAQAYKADYPAILENHMGLKPKGVGL